MMTHSKPDSTHDEPKYTREEVIKERWKIFCHDIKNPISIIQGYQSVIEFDMEQEQIPNYEEFGDYAQAIYLATERIDSVLEDFKKDAQNITLDEE